MRELILILVSVSVLCVGAGFGAYNIERAQCHGKWSGHGETEFSFVTGCRVKIDGKWWPSGAIKLDLR